MILSAAIAGAQSPPISPVPPDSEIRKILADASGSFQTPLPLNFVVVPPNSKQGNGIHSFGAGNNERSLRHIDNIRLKLGA
jgi:hypothetical protein